MHGHLQKSNTSLDVYTQQILKKCQGQSDPNSCYQKNIPDLTKTLSMEDVFLVIEKAQSLDPSFWFCHTLSHELASIEVKKDESKWQEVLHRCPMHQCGSGCLHGTFIAKFQHYTIDTTNQEEIIPQLKEACQPNTQWLPDGEEQASCRHSVGHALVFLTQGDLKLTTSLCDQIEVSNKDDFTENCYEGAFMQIYQPKTQEEYELSESVVPTIDTYQTFCSQFREDIQNICLKESWVLFENKIEDGKWLQDFCSYSKSQKENFLCYKKMFYVVLSKVDYYNSADGKNRYNALCDKLTSPWKSLCQTLPNNGASFDMFKQNNSEKNIDLKTIDKKNSQEKQLHQETIYASAIHQNTVTLKNCQGDPYVIAINQDENLTIINEDSNDHEFAVTSEITFHIPKKSNLSFPLRGTSPGIYGYSCDGMSSGNFGGMIVVK